MDGVGTPIIGRPRPLPGHDTPNPAHNTYTLKCEEPEMLPAKSEQVYQGEGWLILSVSDSQSPRSPSVSRGGVVDSQPSGRVSHSLIKCIKGRGG